MRVKYISRPGLSERRRRSHDNDRHAVSTVYLRTENPRRQRLLEGIALNPA